MTSQSEGTPRRRPPTIDLTATEVTPEPAASGETSAASARAHGGEQQAAGPRVQPGTAGGPWSHALTAFSGAIVAAAIFVGLWWAGLIRPAQNANPPAVNPVTKAISTQLDRIQAELQARPTDAPLAARVAAVEAQTRTLSDSFAGTNRRLDAISAAVQTAREHADAASASASSVAKNSVGRNDLDALGQRIAVLERSIKALSAAALHPNPTAGATDRAARAAVAAESLRAAVERGAPYQAELAAVKALGADQNALAVLEPFAAAGVPRAVELAHELAQLTPSLVPAPAPVVPARDTSLLGRLKVSASELVRITPVSAPMSDDSSALVARLNADAARADIVAALADIARLPPSLKALAQPWVQKANARDAALAASRRIAADALAGLEKPAKQ